MAKKRDDFSDVNDSDFDDDAGWDEFDALDDLPGMGPEGGGSREPAKGVDVKYISSNIAKTKNLDKIGDRIERAYPRVGGLANEISETVSSIETLKRDVLKDIGPTLTQAKRAGKLLLPKVENFLPSKAYSKLTNMLSDDKKYSSPTEEQMRESSIGAELSNVFGAQAEMQQEQYSQRRVDKIIQDKVDDKRHAESHGVLSQIRNLTKSNQMFFQGEYRRYLMKSLELKYRHLYVATDTFEATKAMGLVLENKLTDIVKNTGLPDFVKRTKSEDVRAMMRERMIGATFESARETTENFRKKLFSNIKSKIDENFTSIFNDMIGGASQVAEMDASMGDMGMGFDDGPEPTIGNKVLSALVNKVLIETGAVSAKAFVGDQKLKDINQLAGHIKDNLTEKAQYMIDKHRGSAIGDFFADMIPRVEEERGQISNKFIENANEEVFYDQLSRKAQTEIIPGLLRNILVDTSSISATVQATAAKTLDQFAHGALRKEIDSIEPMVYDEMSEKLVRQSEYKKATMDRIFGSKEERTQRLSSITTELKAAYKSNKGDTSEFDEYFGEIIQVINNLTKHGKTLDVQQLALMDSYLNGESLSSYEQLWMDWLFKDIPQSKHKGIAKILQLSLSKGTTTDKEGSTRSIADRDAIVQLAELLRSERDRKDEGVGRFQEAANKFGNKEVFGNLVGSQLTDREAEMRKKEIRKKYMSRYSKSAIEKDKTIRDAMNAEIREAMLHSGMSHQGLRDFFNDIDVDSLRASTDEGYEVRMDEYSRRQSARDVEDAESGMKRVRDTWSDVGKKALKPFSSIVDTVKSRAKERGIYYESAEDLAGETDIRSHDSFKITDPGVYLQGVERELHMPITEEEESYFREMVAKANNIRDVKDIITELIQNRPKEFQDGVLNRVESVEDVLKDLHEKGQKSADEIKQRLKDTVSEKMEYAKEKIDSIDINVEFSAYQKYLPSFINAVLKIIETKMTRENYNELLENILADIKAVKETGMDEEGMRRALSAKGEEWFSRYSSLIPRGFMNAIKDNAFESVRDFSDEMSAKIKKAKGQTFMQRLFKAGGRWKEALKGMLTGKAEGFEAREGMLGIWDRGKHYMKTTGDAALRLGLGEERTDEYYDKAKGLISPFSSRLKDKDGAFAKAKEMAKKASEKASTFASDQLTKLDPETMAYVNTILSAKNMSKTDKIKAIKELGVDSLTDVAGKLADQMEAGISTAKKAAVEKLKGIDNTVLQFVNTILNSKNMSRMDKVKAIAALGIDKLTEMAESLVDSFDAEAIKETLERQFSDAKDFISDKTRKVKRKLNEVDNDTFQYVNSILTAKNMSKAAKLSAIKELGIDKLTDVAGNILDGKEMPDGSVIKETVRSTVEMLQSARASITDKVGATSGEVLSDEASGAIINVLKEHHQKADDYYTFKREIDEKILSALQMSVMSNVDPEKAEELFKMVSKKWYSGIGGEFVKGTATLMGKGMDTTRMMTGKGMDMVKNFMRGKVKLTGTLLGQLGGVAGGLGTTVGGLGRGFGKYAGGLASGIGNMFRRGPKGEIIDSKGEIIEDGAVEKGPGMFAGMRKGLGNLAAGAGSFAGQGLEKAGGIFGIPGAVTRTGVGAVKALGRGATHLFGMTKAQKMADGKMQNMIDLLQKIADNTTPESERVGGFADYQKKDKEAEAKLAAATKKRSVSSMLGVPGAAVATPSMLNILTGGMLGDDGVPDGEGGSSGGMMDTILGTAAGGWLLSKVKAIKDKAANTVKNASKKAAEKGGAVIKAGNAKGAGVVMAALKKFHGYLPEKLQKILTGPTIQKIVGKLGKNTLIRLAARFAGPIGIMIMAGSAIKDMWDAGTNAESLLGKLKVSASERLRLILAGGIDSFLLNIPGIEFIGKVFGLEFKGDGNVVDDDVPTVSGPTPKSDDTGTVKAPQSYKDKWRSNEAGEGKKNIYKLQRTSKLPEERGSDFHKKTKAWVKGHEGLSLKAYKDSLGKDTIGYGHLNNEGYGSLTKEEADNLFDHDYAKHYEEAMSIPGADKLGAGSLAGLINMVFNMGKGKVLGFKNALAALRSGDSAKVKREVLDSQYARQVGGRAKEVANALASGKMSDVRPKPVALYEDGRIVGSVGARTGVSVGVSDDIAGWVKAADDYQLAQTNKNAAEWEAEEAIRTKSDEYDKAKPVTNAMKVAGVEPKRISKSGELDATTIAAVNDRKLSLMGEQNQLLMNLIGIIESKGLVQEIVVKSDGSSLISKQEQQHPSSQKGKATNLVEVRVADVGSGVDFSRKQAIGG